MQLEMEAEAAVLEVIADTKPVPEIKPPAAASLEIQGSEPLRRHVSDLSHDSISIKSPFRRTDSEGARLKGAKQHGKHHKHREASAFDRALDRAKQAMEAHDFHVREHAP